MAMHTTLASVLAEVDAFGGAPENLALSVAESLIDPEGFTMALVTDKILARGWMPEGVELRDGYRTFRYCSG